MSKIDNEADNNTDVASGVGVQRVVMRLASTLPGFLLKIVCNIFWAGLAGWNVIESVNKYLEGDKFFAAVFATDAILLKMILITNEIEDKRRS